MNNKKYYVLYALMFLPLLIVLFTLPMFPDEIPAHYDLYGNIDRWGSKFESLIFPIITVGMGLFLTFVIKLSKKVDSKQSNENVLLTVGICTLGLFNIMTGIFLYKAYFPAKGLIDPLNIDTNQIINTLLGILIIILGVLMPKSKRNSTFGLRTSWSMKNDEVWAENQKIGGLIMIITGILIILLNLFAKGTASIIFTLLLIIISSVIACVISYKIYKKNI